VQEREYGRQLTLLLSARIQHLRQQRGWSLEELAERAGLHRTSVGLIIRGERGITIATAAALCRALDVRLSSLLAEAERQVAGNG
jgi:transcriptional regulator with XRE-family HTH domain